MHPSVEEAFQQIDAAMFTGDDFEYSDESRARLQYFINRWQKRVDEIDAEKAANDDTERRSLLGWTGEEV